MTSVGGSEVVANELERFCVLVVGIVKTGCVNKVNTTVVESEGEFFDVLGA